MKERKKSERVRETERKKKEKKKREKRIERGNLPRARNNELPILFPVQSVDWRRGKQERLQT